MSIDKFEPMTELKFDERKHIYTLKGFELPSVTTLMNPLSDELYSEISPDVMKKAADRGTAVHEAIEMYSKYGVDEIEPEFEAYYTAFKEWHQKYKPVHLASEYRIYHKTMMYAGTIDEVCLINNHLAIIDYKTTSGVNEMLTRVQLEAYAQAFSSHGIEVSGKSIIHLKSNGKYEMIDYDAHDNECWSVFVALLQINNYKSKFIRRK